MILTLRTRQPLDRELPARDSVVQDPSTPASFVTLADATAIIDFTPGEFTELAYQYAGNPEEFIPPCFYQRGDGSLQELSRDRVGDVSLTDKRLPGLLIRLNDAYALVEWERGAEAREVTRKAEAAAHAIEWADFRD